MKIFEVIDPLAAIKVKLVGLLKQIEGRIEDTGSTNEFSLDAILSMLRKSGINLTAEDFREMSQTEPLSNIISNVQGDDVIFHGGPAADPEEQDAEADSGTIEKMAKRASKSPQL